jgi:hypothetical protein
MGRFQFANTICEFWEEMMGTNSMQAWAIMIFILALLFLGGAMAAGGNLLLLALFLAMTAWSSALFLKCKPWEHKQDGEKSVVKSTMAMERE